MMKSFPIKYQHDSMQCGIACLQVICRYYGRNYSLNILSQYCYATTEGVSLLGISQAANALGFETACAKLSTERLIEMKLPCIIHWDQKHFAVLYRVKKGKRFYISDPAMGLIDYNREDFCKHWLSTEDKGEEKGVAMFIEPKEEFYQKTIVMKKENHSLKFLMRYFRKYKGQLITIALTLLIGSGLQLVLPFLTQQIVDTGIKSKDIDFIWLILVGQLMLVVSRTAVDFLRRWLLLKVSMKINIALISDFFVKLLRLPMSFLYFTADG